MDDGQRGLAVLTSNSLLFVKRATRESSYETHVIPEFGAVEATVQSLEDNLH